MKNQKGFLLSELLIVWFILLVVIGSGWVKNIVKLTKCDFEAPYKTEIIRCAGLIPPVGAIVGWMSIGEEIED